MNSQNAVIPERRALNIGASTAMIVLLVGCASVAVSDDAITERTAFALGIAKGSFTVENRVNDGVRTTYTVKTNRGDQFNCYVTGTVSVTGRIVSDAICNKKGEAAKNPLLR